MHEASSAYIEAMRGLTRTIDLNLSVGVSSDLTAADDVSAITAEALPMSNTAQVLDAVYTLTDGLATFEGSGIRTAASAANIAPPIAATDYPPEAGVWSDVISDADGAIDWTFRVELSKAHTCALALTTDGPSITAATATFYLDGAEVASGDMEPTTGMIQWTSNIEFDAAEVHVTAIESSYRHVRIVELEFGYTRIISKTSLTDTVTIIREDDPLRLSMPLYELDFSILNVDGTWDLDNAAGRYGELVVGSQVTAAVVCTMDDGTRETVPLGRFQIAEKSGSDTALAVTCYDARKSLQDTYMPWSLTTDSTLGAQLDDLLTDLHVPHIVEDEVMAITPDAAYDFGDDISLLDVMLHIGQYYEVWLVPDRDGQIHARYGPPSGSYGAVDADMEYSWPSAYAFTTYNFVQVAYGTDDSTSYYEVDLRESENGGKSQITVSNPLILTAAKAQEVAERIVSRLYAEQVEMEWRTDALPDPGDTMGLFGRHAYGTATEYTVVYDQIAYDGGLSATIRGVRS